MLGMKATHTMLAALMLMNMDYLRAHPETPSVREALDRGLVRVVDSAPGREEWRDIPTMLNPTEGGIAEKRDLAAWIAAENRIRKNQESWPAVVRYPTSNRVTFCVDLFKGDQEQALSHKALCTLLTALAAIDTDYLLAHPEAPDIYQAGVRYEEEPVGQEDWQDIPTTIRMGIGDCEDLACWRAAELRVRYKTQANPTFTYKLRSNGSYLYHITTRHPHGLVEDPSRRLGMR